MATTRKPRTTKTAPKSAATGARRSASRSAAQRTRSTGKAGSRSTPERDSHGRFKPDHHVRNAAFGATAALGAVAAAVAAAFKFGLLDRFLPASEGHSAEDLLSEDHPGPDHRAPAAFRPDIDAPMSAAEKEALRPPRGTRARVDVDSGTIAAT